jgi:NNP family nitrate/nitrite transporter-like MFS transporter
MGSVYGANGSYALGLILPAVAAAATVVFTATVVRRAVSARHGAGEAE